MNDTSEFNYGPQDFLKMKDAISDNASDIEDINDLIGTPPEGYESTIFTDLSTIEGLIGTPAEGYESTIFTDLSTIEEEIGTPPSGYDSDIFTDISTLQSAIAQIAPHFEKLTISGTDIVMSCGNFIIGSMSSSGSLSQTTGSGTITLGQNLPKSTHEFYVLNTNVYYDGTSIDPITADSMFSATTGNCLITYCQPNSSAVSTTITVSFIGIEKAPVVGDTRKSTKKK